MRRLLAAALLCLPCIARAEPVFTGRVSVTGLLYAESDDASGDAGATATRLATTAMLGYGELRGFLEGKRLWKERLDLRLDLRLRGTGHFDYERKFNHDSAELEQALQTNPALGLGVSARGYLGGPEYDLREAYGLLRLTDRYTLQVGRMFVREADGAKIDGVRALRRFGEHWEGSLLAGGYPNPYSRSLLSDYSPPCGAGVAGSRSATVLESAIADARGNGRAPCQGIGPQLGLALGLTARYDYSALWGYVGLLGTLFGGPGDGGPVTPLPEAERNVTHLQLLQPPSDRLDVPRIYLAWLNAWRPVENLDLFTDLVVDFYGGAGPQVTRAVALGTLRLLRDDRLTLRLGYSHLSSLAINMYLTRMLYNRRSGSTLSLQELGIVENNLTVMRTARHEVRATADVRIVRRLGAYLDGRFRHRRLVGSDGDPAAYGSPEYRNNTANLGLELAAGLRDSGSLWGIRAALSYIALFNFRGNSDILSLDLGRDFLKERLTVDLQYVLAVTRDNGAAQAGLPCSAQSPFTPSCFGQRSGTTQELGLVLTVNPWSRLFLLLDYRFIALLTNPIAGVPVPTVLSHSLLGRAEYRW